MVYKGKGTTRDMETPAGSLLVWCVQCSLQPYTRRHACGHTMLHRSRGASAHSLRREQVFISSSDSRRSTPHMKFGIFILPSWPEAETSHQGRIYQEAVEQIQYAEELGFDAVWLAEHHFTRFGIISSAIPFATYVAARTKTIRIGTGVSVLAFHHPVFMAEETAMLDVLSQGRLDFGVGRGQVVYEYNNFKVEYDSRTQRLQQIVDTILGLWRTP